jgi:hypothetical protein
MAHDSTVFNGDIPRFLKLIMIFIDRVGFPVLAFCLMFYMSNMSLQKMTEAISENTKALVQFRTSSEAFQSTVAREHHEFLRKLDGLKKVF